MNKKYRERYIDQQRELRRLIREQGPSAGAKYLEGLTRTSEPDYMDWVISLTPGEKNELHRKAAVPESSPEIADGPAGTPQSPE